MKFTLILPSSFWDNHRILQADISPETMIDTGKANSFTPVLFREIQRGIFGTLVIGGYLLDQYPPNSKRGAMAKKPLNPGSLCLFLPKQPGVTAPMAVWRAADLSHGDFKTFHSVWNGSPMKPLLYITE